MADSKEKSFVRNLIKGLDTLSFDPDFVAYHLSSEGTAIQRQMYNLCLAFIRQWAWRYRNNAVDPEQILYPICKASAIMLDALDEYAACNVESQEYHADTLAEAAVSEATLQWRAMAAEARARLR